MKETLAARGARWALLAALGLAGAAALTGLVVLHAWSAALLPALGAGYWALSALLAVSALLALSVLGRTARSAPLRPGAALRLFFVLLVGTAVCSIACFPTLRPPYLAAATGLAGGLFALCLGLRRPRRPGPLARFLDRLGFGLAAGLLLVELLLRAASLVLAPAILADATAERAWLEARRLRPGSLHLGFPVNSRGDYDREPPAPGATRLVVVIGDSFSTGAVSLPLHYTSVAERGLAGVELYNMGAPGIDPPHYLELLRTEALALRPEAIVVALFAGNDLEFEEPLAEPRPFLRSLVDREGCLLVRGATRAWNVLAERRRARGQGAGGGELQGEDAQALRPDEIARAFPWFADPALERPTFSAEGFLKLEQERALAIARANGPEELGCFDWLAAMQRAAGDIPLLVLLIPDEFQVEDLLWGKLQEALPGVALERDRPQGLLRDFCRARGLPLLDLLPALRAVPPLSDGRRHVYHLRDSHWNARGNEAAGQELARWLAAELAR